MTTTNGTGPIVREIHIDASPDTVFDFFTDPAKLTRWLAVDATLDPRPGGVCHQTHVAGDAPDSPRFEMQGEFITVDRPSRLAFTWGFADAAVGVPVGSSVVEVTLTPEGGGTHLRLEHRALPAAEVAAHEGGWTAMLDRLATAVTGAPVASAG